MEPGTHAVTRREAIALLGATALAGCSSIDAPDRSGLAGENDRRPTNAPRDAAGTAGTEQGSVVRTYVGSYHWGYVVLDEDGGELSRVTLSPGDELRLTLFNVEAEAAVDALPEAIRTNLPGSEVRMQRNREAIPVPQGTSLEALHEAAEAAYPDHSLAIVADDLLGTWSGPWGGHHGPHVGPYGPWGGPGPGQGQGPGTGGPYGPGTGGPYGPGMGGPYGPGTGGPYGPGMGGPYGPGTGGGYWGTNYGTLAPPVYLWHHSTVPQELGFVVNSTGSFGFACTVYCGYGHPYMAERGRVVVNEA